MEISELKRLAGITEFRGYQPYGGSNISVTGNEKAELIKQYRITTDNISKDSSDDCVLDPNDPINEIKRLQYIEGIGYKPYMSESQSISYGQTFGQAGLEKSEIMRKNNIRPGDPEWFALWFSLPYFKKNNDIPTLRSKK